MIYFTIIHNEHLKDDRYKKYMYSHNWHYTGDCVKSLHEAVKDILDNCTNFELCDYFILEYNFNGNETESSVLLDKDIIRIYKYEDLERYYMLV